MSYSELPELLEKRAKVVSDQQAMLGLAERDKREFTADETQTYENLDSEYERLSTEIADMRRAKKEMEERVSQTMARSAALESLSENPYREMPRNADADTGDRERRAYSDAFLKYLTLDNGAAFRSMQVDVDTAGGYLVPEQFSSEIIRKIDNEVFLRQWVADAGKLFKLDSIASLGIPTITHADNSDDWTSEIPNGGVSVSDGPSTGKRVLQPRRLMKIATPSRDLIKNSAVGADRIVMDELAYLNSITFERAYFEGDGSGQPMGLFVASDNGIPAERDVSTDNTTTEITTDNLIEVKYSLKPGYSRGAKWIFHRNTVKEIRKLKDGYGQYLWKQGLKDEDDTILDLPYAMSEYCPNTFEAGKYVGILGNFAYYWIADFVDFYVQVLEEKYITENKIGYMSIWYTDGMPVVGEAFSRVTLASA